MTLQHNTSEPPRTQPDPRVTRHPDGPILTHVALLLLGDILFWHQTPGLSLAIFANAIFATTSRSPDPSAIAALILAVLPVLACAFRGGWALSSRDRWCAFHAMPGSPFTGSWADWPRLSWGQA